MWKVLSGKPEPWMAGKLSHSKSQVKWCSPVLFLSLNFTALNFPVSFIFSLKRGLKKIELKHCDEENIDFIEDITNKPLLKRRKASIKPKLEDVTEGSTEDDDEDVRETIAVSGFFLKCSDFDNNTQISLQPDSIWN